MTLGPGTRLGPYEIVAPLGAGGMGEVYRAHDTRLGRDVALKVLPERLAQDPERQARLEREAKVLASLNHPSIAVLYGLELLDRNHALVMELVEGEGLDGRIARGAIPVEEAVAIALQIAAALEAAHERGIVHRDLKPANVKVRSDGAVKVLDFGLAKAWEGPVAADDPGHSPTVTGVLTREGMILGTAAYMSPEQARGGAVDKRTDIWSFGVVLWEMLTGARLFDAPTFAETLANVLTRVPDIESLPAATPLEVGQLLRRCLEPDPKRRLRDIGEARVALGDVGVIQPPSPLSPAAHGEARDRTARLLAHRATRALPARAVVLAVSGAVVLVGILLGLRAVGWPPALSGRADTRPIRSLAVLPLASFSADPDQQFFADGMTDAIITDLARIGALRVVSRASVMRFRGTQETIPVIARRLNVDALVTGSVERSGGRVRITAQLIRATTDQHVWANSYERDLRDVLVLQDEVARSVAAEIKVELTPEEHRKLSEVRTVDPQAYELYLKGRYFWNKRSREAVDKAMGCFRQAIDRDPGFASAYGGLADCYMSLGFSFDLGELPPREAIPKAKAAAARALEIDEAAAEAHTPLAFIKLNYDWDFAGAEREFRRALELDPGNANAHHWYAHLLIATGRKEEALAESKRALELDPLNPIINLHLAWHELMVREYGGAVEQLGKTLELEPGYGLAYWYLGLAHEGQGRLPEAAAALRHANELLKGHLVVEADLARVLALSGRVADARRSLEALKRTSRERYVSPFELALVHLALGERDEAFRWLETAYQDRSDLLVYLNVDPRLDAIRGDPRFPGLVRRVGLPE